MHARRLPAARGGYWLFAGFHLYRRNPPLLSMMTFANLLLVLLFSQWPPVGPFILLLCSPLIMALIANACEVIARSGLMQWSATELVEGLRKHIGLLWRLGMLQLCYVTLVVVTLDLLLPGIDPAALGGGEATDAEKAAKIAAALSPEQVARLLLHLAAMLLAVLPVFWFAPLLTARHGVPPLKSAFFSVVAVWRNWPAFLAYGAAAAAIGVFLPGLLMLLFAQISTALGEIVATTLRLLVMLVFAPVLTTGAYLSYRDIFAEPPQDQTTSAPEGKAP